MNIDSLLGEIERTFPAISRAWKAKDLCEKTEYFAHSLLLDVVDPIHASVRALLPYKEIQTSHLDGYWNTPKTDIVRPHPYICTARVRPSKEYSGVQPRSTSRAIRPGVAVEFSLFGPFPNNQDLCQASLDISFVIRGSYERQCFSDLLSENRGILREIWDVSKLRFENAFYVEQKKRTPFDHLDRYYDEEDPENHFKLYNQFFVPVDIARVAQIFTLFMLLFSGVQIYSKKPNASLSRMFRKLASRVMDS